MATIRVTDRQPLSNEQQLVDRVTSPTYKWFSLQDNGLDGTYKPVPSDDSLQLGWWGQALSDAGGLLTRFAEAQVQYRSCNRCPDFNEWELIGDSYINANGELVLTKYGDSARSPFISIDEINWKWSVEYDGPHLQNSTYFDANFNPIANSGGHAGNGNANTTTPDDWVRRSWHHLAGTGVKYIRMAISTHTSWTGPTLKARKPMMLVTSDPGDSPVYEVYMPVDGTNNWINTLSLTGDELLDEYPVAFDVHVYEHKTLLYAEAVHGNNTVQWKRNLQSALNATHVLYTIKALNKPYRTVKLLDVSDLFEVVRKDTIRSKVSETVSTLGIGVTTSDSLRVGMSETRATTALIGSADSLAAKLSPLSTLTAIVQALDSLRTSLVTHSSISAQLYSAEQLLAKIVDNGSIVNTLSSSDTVSNRINEQRFLTSILYGQDSVRNGVNEASTLTAALSAVDTLLTSVDTNSSVQNLLGSSDALKALITEASNLTAVLIANDNIFSNVTEVTVVTNLFASVDELLTRLHTDTTVIAAVVSNDAIYTNAVEQRNTNVKAFASDILVNSLPSQTTVINNLTAQDLVTVVGSYVTSASVLVDSVDDIAVGTEDTSFFTQYELWKSDTISSKLGSTAAVQASLASSDSVNTRLMEANKIVVSFSNSDVLNVSANLAENKHVTASFTRPDEITIEVYELNNVSNRLVAFDAIRVDVSEYVSMTNTLSSADDIRTEVSSNTHVTNKLQSSDGITVKSNMTDDVTFETVRGDTLKLSLKERSFMENVYTAMDAATRQVFGKVEITYTDVFSDETITASASETGRYTYPEQLADNVTVSAYKWFSLHENKLDGSYHPLPSEQEYSVGWWGSTLSDEHGAFAVLPVVAIEFAPRSVSSLRLCGSAKLETYPTQFTMRLLDASGQELAVRHAVNNTAIDWQEQLPQPVLGVVKIEAVIHSINKPSAVAKLTEMYTAVKEIYGQDDIESINIIEETGYVTGGLPIGNISANEIDIVLQNRNRKFDLNNNQSSLHGLVKKNRRVKVWLGAEIGGNMEWHPMGTYWTALWDIPRNSLVATLTARDRLDLLRSTDFIVSAVYRDKTLYELFEIVLQDAGLSDDEYELDDGLHGVTVPYAWFDRMSHRSALQRLAGAAVIQVYCTKEGKIRVNIDADATETVMATFDDDTNVYDSKYPLAVGEQVNYVDVTARKISPGVTEQLFDSAVDLKVVPGESATESYRFRQIPVLEIDTIEIDTVDLVVEYQLYAWGVDVTYTNNTEETVNLGYVSISGKTLKEDGRQSLVAKDDVSIKDDGKITVNITHDFIQSARYAQELAERILNIYRVGRYDVTLDNRGNIALRLGDRVNVKDSYSDAVEQYSVYRQQIQWAGYLSATTEAKKL